MILRLGVSFTVMKSHIQSRTRKHLRENKGKKEKKTRARENKGKKTGRENMDISLNASYRGLFGCVHFA